MIEHSASRSESFAAQLDRLFRTVRREDGEKHVPRQVAEEITRRAAERGEKLSCSKSYMYALLDGKSEPSYALVQAIAEVFGVELTYFSKSEHGQKVRDEHELLAKLGAGNVQEIAARAQELTSEQLKHVLAFIEFEASRGDGGESDA